MTWAHRMDHYYAIKDSQIHWMQLGISLGVIGLITLIFFTMVYCGVSSDFLKLSDEAVQRAERRKARVQGASRMQIDSSAGPSTERAKSTVGWKKLYSQVFRPPTYPAIYSCLIGTGA